MDTYPKLNRYRWCGHGVVVGHNKNDWQHRDYVLKWFGSAESLVKKVCNQAGISEQALCSGSRICLVSKVRSELALRFVQQMGLSLAEAARLLGVSTSAIALVLRRSN